jgi:hypothetical protein
MLSTTPAVAGLCHDTDAIPNSDQIKDFIHRRLPLKAVV